MQGTPPGTARQPPGIGDLSGGARRRSLLAVIAAMAVVNLVFGLSLPLLALVLDSQGVDKGLIGLSTMAQAAAVLFIAPVAPRLMRRVAPVRLMQLATVILAGAFLLLPLFPNIYAWFPIRLVIGAGASFLWIASEAVINELAEERWRGRIIGLYASAGAAGLSIGPLVLIATGSEGLLPFATTSVLIALAGLPLFLASRTKPAAQHEDEQSAPLGLFRMVLLAPAIMLVNVAYAACSESLSTFFPLYGQQLGLSETGALGLMTVMGIGGIVLMLPLGWLADHLNRLRLLIVCVSVTIAGLLAMSLFVALPWAGPVYIFVFGGIEGMIYALGVMLMGERFRGAALAAASTVYTAMWGTGTMLGPPLVGAGMDLFGDRAMPYLIALFFIAYLPFALARLLQERRPVAQS